MSSFVQLLSDSELLIGGVLFAPAVKEHYKIVGFTRYYAIQTTGKVNFWDEW